MVPAARPVSVEWPVVHESGQGVGVVSDLEGFMEQLSSPSPVPGGGSVAAIECALAAALLAMVSNLTMGRKRYADAQTRISEILPEVVALRNRASELADEDAEAYGRVSRVMEMPRGTDEEKAARRARLQDALKDAIHPPLQTMQLAGRVIELSAELAKIGNPSAISDVGSAAAAARAGFDGALLNVEINLAAIDDGEWVDGIRATLLALPSVAGQVDEINRHVLEVIRG